MNGIQSTLAKIEVNLVHLYAKFSIPFWSFCATSSDAFGRKILANVPPTMMMNIGITSIILNSATVSAPLVENMPNKMGREWVAVIWNRESIKMDKLNVKTVLKSFQCPDGLNESISLSFLHL